MAATVLFFGAIADISGTRAIEIDISPQTTTSVLIQGILERFPMMSRHKLIISINEEYVKGDPAVIDGDEIAIFTAVSGG